MKIGTITWWRYNYGSILQAYALQQKLKELGYEDYEIICQYGKKIVSISNLREKLKRVGLKETTRRIIWKYGLRKLRKRNSKIQNFVDTHLKVSEKEYNEDNIKEANNDYDTFICGSDQIWNPKLTEINSMYWLTFANEDKLKISYAPSIGVNEFTDIQEKEVKDVLKSFKAISSRESTGTDLINKTLGEEKCQTVLDPTLLVEKKVWDNLLKEEVNNKKTEPYIFVYMLRGTKKQRKFIENFAKSKKLKIITMPFLDNEKINLYDFKFGDEKCWDGSPIEFINLIKNAEYVFTDSFHSMIFSCIYHTEFFTFPKIGKAQLNRIYAFQKLIGAEERMITEDIDIQTFAKIEKIDWKKVDSTFSQRRKESEKYLKDALNNK